MNIKFTNKQKRGRGLWKMNCKYLKDEKFRKSMKYALNQAKLVSLNIENRQLRWEFIKYCIRTKCIDYSINQSRESKIIEHNLLLKLNFLEEEFDKNPTCDKYEE